MSISTQLGRSLPKSTPLLNRLHRHSSGSAIDTNRILPEIEPANLAPFIIPKKEIDLEVRKSTAVGTRDVSAAFKKFENEPAYNLFKELVGYNDFITKEIVVDPSLGTTLSHPYTKQYVRDPATGLATMPKRFDGHITYEELQSALQKADHYFFSDRPNPVVQLYVPLDDPRITNPTSPLAKAAALVDKMTTDPMKVTKYTSFKTDDDMYNFLDKQFDNIYKTSENTNNTLGVTTPNPGTLGVYSLTAQQRRAEFWKKYLDLFNYYDVLHACTVRCTRTVGRVAQSAALVIIGNCHGIFAYGRGKASNYELAVRRALLRTRRNVLFTPLHENRTAYYAHKGTWKKTSLMLIPYPRGVGMRAGRLTFNLLKCVGYKDASLKMLGRRNMWNLVRAWMDCLRVQESYREVAFARGAHYQEFMDPFCKNPPPPSREEVQELENAAATAFHDAIQTVFKNRQLLMTDSYASLRPHFELRDGFEEKWKQHLEKKGVPEQFHQYPAFSEYLDAVGSINGVFRRLKLEDTLHKAAEAATHPYKIDENHEYQKELDDRIKQFEIEGGQYRPESESEDSTGLMEFSKTRTNLPEDLADHEITKISKAEYQLRKEANPTESDIEALSTNYALSDDDPYRITADSIFADSPEDEGIDTQYIVMDMIDAEQDDMYDEMLEKKVKK